MSTKQIHVFISHSWAYSSHYDTLSGWIFNEKWSVGQASLDFRDFSVPQNDPIHNASNDTQLKNAIYNKISNSHVIVIPTGMYVNYSKWIKKEIEGANNSGAPCYLTTFWDSCHQHSFAYAANGRCPGRHASVSTTHKTLLR